MSKLMALALCIICFNLHCVGTVLSFVTHRPVGSLHLSRIRSSNVHRAMKARPRSSCLRCSESKKNVENIVEDGDEGDQVGAEKGGTFAGLNFMSSGDSKGADDSSSVDGSEVTAASLFKKYGSAYLLSSIPLAILSFSTCYLLVTSGVDVAAVLTKVGIQPTDTTENIGNFGIAYAAHKALSPVRFPPTIALTAVVARWMGKDGEEAEEA